MKGSSTYSSVRHCAMTMPSAIPITTVSAMPTENGHKVWTLLERAVPDQLERGRKDRARRRHEDRIHPAAVIFPHHEEDRDRGGADGVGAQHNLAQALRPCRVRRRDRLAWRRFR